jgi:hypothetical protein
MVARHCRRLYQRVIHNIELLNLKVLNDQS